LFNIWQGTLQDCRWLDLCAGTGVMGAEALCRGASRVVGIEQNGRACTVISENWRQVATPEQHISLLRGDVRSKLQNLTGQQFDRIYFDPPYASDLYQPVIEAIARYQLLAPQGEMAIEHSANYLGIDDIEAIAQATGQLTVYRHKHYGNTDLTFLGSAEPWMLPDA
jgi:16S rRNA (guanine(966)-N(2))-methyltransferase RsmD